MTRRSAASIPHSAASADTAEIPADLLATLGPLGRAGWCLLVGLVAIVCWGAGAYIYQLRHGLAATGMNDYFSWGLYIINYIFLIGVGMAGTLISAMLRLTGASWRRSITRLAEAITLFALLLAGPMIMIDMGRPDRFLNLLIHGRLQSPILWDVFSLNTYLAGSLLYLYLPMIPDMALLRDCSAPFAPWRRRLYRVLALGWHGDARQHRRLEKAMAIMAIIILPVAVSLHTITAWIFGLTLRPGWHSTIIGPDYVIGALYSGIAAVITVMAIFRRSFHLEKYLTADHFRKLGLLLLTLCAVYFYFTLNEYVGPSFVTETAEIPLLAHIFHGPYTVVFWSMATVGFLLPGLLLALPWTRNIPGIVTASVLVNIGMWLMRFIIVVPTLSAPYLPFPPGTHYHYVPTLVEWSITAGAFAAFGVLYLVFAKLFPIVSIWETMETEPKEATVPVAANQPAEEVLV